MDTGNQNRILADQIIRIDKEIRGYENLAYKARKNIRRYNSGIKLLKEEKKNIILKNRELCEEQLQKLQEVWGPDPKENTRIVLKVLSLLSGYPLDKYQENYTGRRDSTSNYRMIAVYFIHTFVTKKVTSIARLLGYYTHTTIGRSVLRVAEYKLKPKLYQDEIYIINTADKYLRMLVKGSKVPQSSK